MTEKNTWAEIKRSFDFDSRGGVARDEADIAADVGALVRAARIEAKMSQSALADAIGTHQPAIARLEGGANVPTVDTLVRVARALGQYVVVGILTEAEAKEAGLVDRSSGRATLIPRFVSPEEGMAEAYVEKGVGAVDRFFGCRRSG